MTYLVPARTPGRRRAALLRRIAVMLAVVPSAALLAACGGSGGSGASGSGPIAIGASVPLSGDLAAQGQAFQRGYELWADDVNRTGGLLGRKVKLDVLSDATSPVQVVSNYQKLISSDHVALVLGPVGTLLTVPASKIAARYGYALVEGAGGGPAVFAQGLHNVFDVSVAVRDNLVSFAQWVASLPAAERPRTAAYATSNEQFTQPQIPVAQKILEAAGVKTVYSKVFPAEVTDFAPIAGAVAGAHADVVVLGSSDVPSVSAFVHAFIQQHYSPKALIATSGPDQGDAFLKAVGTGNAEGVMVPGDWYAGVATPESQAMVKAYIAKFGGTEADVSAGVAEGYSAGQVLQQAVEATHGLDNEKIVAYLHSGATFHSVQGPVRFDALGENAAAQPFEFQWQHGKLARVLPAGTGSAAPAYPKPAWVG